MLLVTFVGALGYAFRLPRKFWDRKEKRAQSKGTQGKRLPVVLLVSVMLSAMASFSPRVAAADEPTADGAMPVMMEGGPEGTPLIVDPFYLGNGYYQLAQDPNYAQFAADFYLFVFGTPGMYLF